MKYKEAKIVVSQRQSTSFSWEATATITIMDQEISTSSGVSWTSFGAHYFALHRLKKRIRRQIKGKI